MLTHAEYQAFKALAPTPPDIEGPFYKPGAPARAELVPGGSLAVSGRVLGTDGAPVPGAVLDVWQADPAGEYDNAGFNFRGKMTAASEGAYRFVTVRPGDYKISDTEFRCAHIHVKVTAPGFRPLTTQLYFHNSPHNDTDHWYDPRREIGPGGEFDFVLERE
jgi:protocatechuate 3,4-dioxygenase beta subunit